MTNPVSDVPGGSHSADRLGRLLIALAALIMAAGVAVSAAAAHAGAGRDLAAASLMLTTGAPMLAAVGLAIALGKLGRLSGGIGALAALAGTLLFAADMLHRAFSSGALFPMAAPVGGSLTITGWSIVGICGLIKLFRR